MNGYTDDRDWIGGAAVVSGSTTVIVGPYDLIKWPGRSIQLLNCNASLTLSGAIVQVNNDNAGNEITSGTWPGGQPMRGPNSALWINYDSTTFQSMGPATSKGTTLPGAYRWWRVVGVSDQSSNINVSGYGWAASRA